MKVGYHFLFHCVLCLIVAQPAVADLQLAAAGTTNWQIVRSADASGVDRYAADTLADYFQQITGAAFPVLGPDAVNLEKPAIFVGMSEPALRHLGRDPLAALEDQEHVTRSIGPNIFLYGKGVHGNLHAVMEFLENSLGWRWYSVYEPPVVPSEDTVTLAPFHRTRGFSFKCREVALRYSADFYLQNGINMGLETKLRSKGLDVPPHLVSWLPTDKFVHSSFAYIPPAPTDRHAHDFPWMERRDYFQTNPEYFSVSEAGRRVANLQLCYSNPSLRAAAGATISSVLGGSVVAGEADGSQQPVTMQSVTTSA